MAKIPFTKLKCKINTDEIPVQIGEETIAVKQYLPIQDKLGLIERVIEFAHMQDENYSNPVKAAVFRDLEIIFNYTNISFTDKQKEDVAKLYDTLYSSGVIENVISNIPKEEYDSIVKGVQVSASAIYDYQNSLLGILNGLKDNYKDLKIDVEDVEKTMETLSNSPILQRIAEHLA